MRSQNAGRSRWFIAGIAGLLFAAAAGWLCFDLGRSVAGVNHFSNVEAPAGAIIADLAATARAGDCDLLRRKVELLDRRWQEVRESGSVLPSGFHREIIGLR